MYMIYSIYRLINIHRGGIYMATTISFLNNKGGAGKTASTEIIAELLASLDNKVLVVDLDHQCNLSMIFRRYLKSNYTIRNIFLEKLKTYDEVKNCIQRTDIKGIEIIASCKEHNSTQRFLNSDHTSNNNIILKRALETVKKDYDYIIIDNAPANDTLIVNSMIASDYVFIPGKSEQLSYEGLKTTFNAILKVQEEFMLTSLKFGGAFLVATEPSTILHRNIVEQYENELGNKFLKSYIRKDIKVAEMETYFKPLMSFAPFSNALFDYGKLLLEMNILSSAQENLLKEALGI